MTKDQYRDYLQSVWWRSFREFVVDETDQCEECGIGDTLNVHHRHYRTLGHETREDVIVLCERCHMNTHIIQSRAKMFRVPIQGRSIIERRDFVMKQINKIRGD